MENSLDTALKLSKEGRTDAEIVSTLREQGWQPHEISDAMNQAKVKQELSPEMQPSIMQAEPQAPEQPELPVPVPSRKMRAASGKSTMQDSAPAQSAQSYAYPYPSAETAAAPAQYPYPVQQSQYPYYYDTAAKPASSGVDIEAIEEISEEIVNEKFEEFKSKVGDVAEIKQMLQARINDLDDRIKRIENSMDKLQLSVISRVQDYGQGIKSLGSEMAAMEEAFGKILNPLVDNIKELDKITGKLKDKAK